MTYIAPRS